MQQIMQQNMANQLEGAVERGVTNGLGGGIQISIPNGGGGVNTSSQPTLDEQLWNDNWN